MPKRLPYEAAILAALLLGSCDNMPSAFTKADRQRLDYAEANGRNAARASSEMVDRVERGERRIEELETKVRNLERMDDAIAADLRAFAQRFNTHTH